MSVVVLEFIIYKCLINNGVKIWKFGKNFLYLHIDLGMIQFFKTLIAGIKEGAIAAWYDLRWYICVMAIILVVYLAFMAVKKLFK